MNILKIIINLDIIHNFKFLKGLELTFKNKINIYLKTCGSHYVYNRPVVCVKGLMKPPMYNDYSGTTVIQDVDDENVKCELTFIEQSWTNNKIGDIEGKSYSSNGEVKYLIGGNWQEEIYITDPDENNKKVLLSLSKNTTYLGNTMEKYTLPFYSCNLNFINEDLKKSLPKNDSRFRQDMRFMEKGEAFINKAQMYKSSYEVNQILFFTEKKNEETEEVYYVPNGLYWEMKKDGRLKDNIHKDIFEVDEYLKDEEEKEKQREKEEKEKKEKEEKEKKEKEEKEKEEKEKKEKEEKEKEEKEKKEKEDGEKEDKDNKDEAKINKEKNDEIHTEEKSEKKEEKNEEKSMNKEEKVDE